MLPYSDDLSKVIVKVGRDLMVELTQQEALQFLIKKEIVLNKRIDSLTD